VSVTIWDRRETGRFDLVFLVRDINLVLSLFGITNSLGKTHDKSSHPLRMSALLCSPLPVWFR
jgi:hypothetical protein